MLAEKEYHFDESVGVSLRKHCRDLKARYPSATVQTRRDRDGFAIVKLSFKPEYKYDLDTILAATPQAVANQKAETLEAILRAALPDPEERLKQLDPSQLEQSIGWLT